MNFRNMFPAKKYHTVVCRVMVGCLVLVSAVLPFYSILILEVDSTKNFVVTRMTTKAATPNANATANRATDAAEVDGDYDPSSTNICLTSTCFTETASLLARAYPYKTNHSAWIRHAPPTYGNSDEGNNYTHSGIIYVKNFKAASSTAAGIALRIAHRHVDPQNGQHAFCKWSHVRAFKYAQRDPPHSLLFTSVRDPASRALSRIFYTSITQKGEDPTDANLLQKLHWNHPQYGAVSHHGGGYQVRYCSMNKILAESWNPQRPNEVVNPSHVQHTVQTLLLAYDFIMVAERMEESVVAFALLFNLSLSDVLVMNAKQNSNRGGNRSSGRPQGQDYLYFSWHDPKEKMSREVCKLSIPSHRSPAVQAHLQSIEWKAKNYGDYLLHKAASQSLDRTIAQTLGQDRFSRSLQEYQRLKAKAQTLCANETFSHCSSTGEIQRDLSSQNCYADDSGCGYQCIDNMLMLMAINRQPAPPQQHNI